MRRFLLIFLAVSLQLFAGEPLEDLVTLIGAPPEQWVQQGKERWEFEMLGEDQREEILPLLKRLGFIDAVDAAEKEYDYAVVHGSLYPTIKKRIAHLALQYQHGVRFREIVLLTGQRLLEKTKLEKDLPFDTETEMVLYAWETADLPVEMRKLPLTVVDAKMHNGRRPTTKDTLLEWLNSNPTPGRCLMISNQPYVQYQDELGKAYLPSDFIIETIGDKADENMPMSVHLDNIGRFLWVKNGR